MKPTPKRLTKTLFVLLMACLGAARGQGMLTIEISGGTEGAMPIAVVPFAWTGPGHAPVDLAAIIDSDLNRTGRFDPLQRAKLIARPTNQQQAKLNDWRLLGTEALVMGSVEILPQRRARVRFELVDVPRATLLKSRLFDVGINQLRQVAHHIADLIYEALTGERGAFNTRIAYVTASPRGDQTDLYELIIADSDGHNDQRILSSVQPILSPAWSPDGQKLAYVSFETGRPEVWVHTIATEQRHAVAKWKGSNSAPAWSPDGRRLALALSKDGNAEIYVLELATGRLTRITNSRAIDTEPAWMPDGRTLVFTSNRGGSPQLYRVSVGGGRPSRITFEGNYNAAASIAPDGRSIALVHREDGAYRIAVQDLVSNELRVLTSSRLDESPSFAPNGRLILFATEGRSGRGILSGISVDGRSLHRLSRRAGSVRSPAWGPFSSR